MRRKLVDDRGLLGTAAVAFVSPLLKPSTNWLMVAITSALSSATLEGWRCGGGDGECGE
jgi:hypothetical protein